MCLQLYKSEKIKQLPRNRHDVRIMNSPQLTSSKTLTSAPHASARRTLSISDSPLWGSATPLMGCSFAGAPALATCTGGTCNAMEGVWSPREAGEAACTDSASHCVALQKESLPDEEHARDSRIGNERDARKVPWPKHKSTCSNASSEPRVPSKSARSRDTRSRGRPCILQSFSEFWCPWPPGSPMVVHLVHPALQ